MKAIYEPINLNIYIYMKKARDGTPVLRME